MKKTVLLATGLLLAACGNREQAEPATDSRAPASQLPAAILGQAPPPQGVATRYFASDETTVGYLSVPEGEGPFPALILIHEWNGLVDRVRQVADAFASEGYVVLAADLYHGATGSSRDENVSLMNAAHADMDAVILNLDAAQGYLEGRGDVTGKVGVIGWCFGGGIALSYGLGGKHHDATAMFYGSLVEDPAVLATLDHPIYGSFAENDGGIPVDQVTRFAATLDSLGIDNDIHVYDDVNHGFWLRVDEDPGVREQPARDAWNRLKRFLARTLS